MNRPLEGFTKYIYNQRWRNTDYYIISNVVAVQSWSDKQWISLIGTPIRNTRKHGHIYRFHMTDLGHEMYAFGRL